jgi:cardiolipin-specific phospholipase
MFAFSWRYAAVLVPVGCVLLHLLWFSKLPASNESLKEAEQQLLNSISRPKGATIERRYYNGTMPINTIVAKANNNDDHPKIVLLHGLWAGAGIWHRLLQPLSTRFDVYAIDLPGFGRSFTPAFHGKNYRAAMDWWLGHIEAWREAAGIETFTIVAHSLGSIIASEYSLRYPKRVHRLFLIAPVGVIKPIFRGKRLHRASDFVKSCFRTLFHVVKFLKLKRTHLPWLLGPYKHQIIFDVLKKRSWWYGAHTDQIKEYLYQLCVCPGAGEDAFMALVGWGEEGPQIENCRRRPAVDLVQLQSIVPLHFVFGGMDFLDYERISKRIHHTAPSATICIVRDTGHHVYSTGADRLAKLILGLP